ncbi:MAG: M28 family peptidase [Deltaproteobacteria bacterium]|nr:MAG: M28 family peptidase [Deltaproteobacteria bacterium]
MREHTDTETMHATSEAEHLRALVAEMLRIAPVRRPLSEDERRVHAFMAKELQARGLRTWTEAFRFNDHLYANLLLHFGLGTVATAIARRSPLVGATLHGLVATSYLMDNTRRGYLLRRLFPWRDGQNQLAIRPAAGTPRRRVVLVAHADSAYTGVMFRPDVIARFAGGGLPDALKFLERGTGLAVFTQAGLAGLALLRALSGRRLRGLVPLELLLTAPAAIAALLNLDVVLRNTLVPGANDNLSGTAALAILAERLTDLPDDVEVLYVIAGAEETSLGGSDALARDRQDDWDRDRTLVVGVDTLGGGDLRYIVTEGEVLPAHVPQPLQRLCREVAAADPRFADAAPYAPPVGATDAASFLVRGFQAVCISRIDPAIGAPRHYHLPSDTLEHLEPEECIRSVDFVEALVRRWLGTP